ncbi:MAG: threonine ammonia-lyase [Lachnospiraceae bacterium]|nr:threonine ammonia-lyase [Lachnospiraceae bacterium]
MLTLDKIYQASFVLKDVVRQTDILSSRGLKPDAHMYLKTENLQTTGSFKVRGAYYKISQLTEEQKKAGVIACSAGNHAQGVALSATKNGIKSVVCMPDGAPISKVEATKSYGAEVVLVPGVYDDAYSKAIELQKEKGYTFVHPFDDEDVIAGQGTIGLEILNQIENIDAVVVPIGGGGLISGVAFAIKSLKPNIKVYGVQAANAPSMYESIKQKSKITLDAVSTFADGIAVKHPGDLTYELVNKYVDEVVTVSEDEIAMSILTLIERQKLISEGAGATSVAAVLSDKIPVNNKNVVCVVSGGNIDVNILSRVLTRGLKYSGRNVSMQIALEDKPGQLVLVSTIISKCGGNIINVRYERSDLNMPISSCYLTIGMETKNFAHIEMIKEELTKAGLKIVNVM